MATDYRQALQRAIDLSLQPANDGCSIYVQAILGLDKQGEPAILGYNLDTFYDGSTVATVTSGSVVGR